jgi:hypothetical protein
LRATEKHEKQYNKVSANHTMLPAGDEILSKATLAFASKRTPPAMRPFLAP